MATVGNKGELTRRSALRALGGASAMVVTSGWIAPAIIAETAAPAAAASGENGGSGEGGTGGAAPHPDVQATQEAGAIQGSLQREGAPAVAVEPSVLTEPSPLGGPAPAGGGGLPFTGEDVQREVVVALGLVAGGAAAVASGREPTGSDPRP